MLFLAQFPSLWFFYAQHHILEIFLCCDFGRMLLESSKTCSTPQRFKHVNAAWACYSSTQKNQSLRVQKHIVKRLMANTTRKFIAELLVTLNKASSLIKCYSTRRGRREENAHEWVFLFSVRLLWFASSNLIQAAQAMQASEQFKLASNQKANEGEEEGSK